MERDKGIEPSPPPWQGGVLPLYESRPLRTQQNELTLYSTRPRSPQDLTGASSVLTKRPGVARFVGTPTVVWGLIDFHDARCLHDRRLLLAFGKAFGTFTVDIHPGELLTVVIVDSNLPVAMLTTAILVKPGRLLGTLLFHDGLAPRKPEYSQALTASRKYQVVS
jgi:hypothetical protein